jgi:hypothetical protein
MKIDIYLRSRAARCPVTSQGVWRRAKLGDYVQAFVILLGRLGWTLDGGEKGTSPEVRSKREYLL